MPRKKKTKAEAARLPPDNVWAYELEPDEKVIRYGGVVTVKKVEEAEDSHVRITFEDGDDVLVWREHPVQLASEGS